MDRSEYGADDFFKDASINTNKRPAHQHHLIVAIIMAGLGGHHMAALKHTTEEGAIRDRCILQRIVTALW